MREGKEHGAFEVTFNTFVNVGHNVYTRDYLVGNSAALLCRRMGTQRIPAMRDHQLVNLLKRCLAGSSAASTFYWSLIHNRDIDVTRTLVNKLNLVDNSIYRVLFGNTRRLFYDIGNDGLSNSVRFLLHSMNNDNFRILQNILLLIFNALL